MISFVFILFLTGEEILWGQIGTAAADLKVAVVAAGTAGAAHIADELALADALARIDAQGQAVRIDRGVATGVADDDRVAVAGARARLIVARLGDGAPAEA